MTFPELVAPTSQPYSDVQAALSTYVPEIAATPQSWNVTVADAKYHWYDLIAGYPELPDVHDPIGRYLRRMQFELEAAAEHRQIYFVVTRPKVRFDTGRPVQWGFFSLKLTLPILMGNEGQRDSLAIELTAPFAATMKKPTVTLADNFVILNWGGLIQALSIHDVLQNHAGPLQVPGKVVYVGQTRDPDCRLAKGRLLEVQKLHQQQSQDVDTLLLIQHMDVQARSADGALLTPAANLDPVAADALRRDRMDVVEAALIRYFEGERARPRDLQENIARRERLLQAQSSNKLMALTLDFQLNGAGAYRQLGSECASAAPRHLLSCDIVDGVAMVARLPLPEKNGKA